MREGKGGQTRAVVIHHAFAPRPLSRAHWPPGRGVAALGRGVPRGEWATRLGEWEVQRGRCVRERRGAVAADACFTSVANR
jgi:hypothetical protein